MQLIFMAVCSVQNFILEQSRRICVLTWLLWFPWLESNQSEVGRFSGLCGQGRVGLCWCFFCWWVLVCGVCWCLLAFLLGWFFPGTFVNCLLAVVQKYNLHRGIFAAYIGWSG
jgi:hypothetical protein